MTRHAQVRILSSRPVAHPQLPRLPANHISRPRLSELLLASDCRLSLLCAPAGFGKSVLLNECVRHAPAATRLVWLDLLGRSLTPTDLLARLAQALQAPIGPGAVEDALADLLAGDGQPLWIVLNDYPREPSPELDACLDHLLERTPPSVRWWISGRRRPAWNLPRLLLQDDLLELDAEALAFDRQELRHLLDEQRLSVTDELLERLLHECEGWPAGLCLLLFKSDEEGLRERLSAGSPLLQEYVVREVLQDLSPALTRVLRILAHIPRFSAELCDHLLEENGRELLDELRNRQLFLHSLDSSGQWYRLWRPLALILKRQSGGSPTQAHLRACRWFFQRGDVREAVEHALWAEQPEVAASYLQRFGQEQLLVEHSVTQFIQWRDELPPTLFASTPRLITLLGWALMICARLDEVDKCLVDLGRFLPQADARRQRQLLAQWQALQGMVQRQRGLPSARQHCLEALEVLSESAWSQRILCLQALTQQALALGELATARHYGGEGLRLARLKGSVAFEGLLDTEQLHLLALEGEFVRGTEQAAQAVARSAAALQHGPVVARVNLLHGSLLAAQGLHEQAQAAYRIGMQEAEQSEDAYRLYGYVGLIDLAIEDNDFAQADQLLREAERVMQCQHVPEVRYFSVLRYAEGQLRLAAGEPAVARELFIALLDSYADGRLTPSGFYDLLPRAGLALALCDLRMGQVERARNALRTLLDTTQAQGLLPLACECRFALVEALLAEDRQNQAEAELRRALSEAQRMELFRPLRHFHRLHPHLLLLHASTAQRARLQLEETVDEAPRRGSNSPLSSRELAVLSLIAQGLSNQEIAERLFISLHTVKTHARRINSKLKVERRTQAVAHAKALGLFD